MTYFFQFFGSEFHLNFFPGNVALVTLHCGSQLFRCCVWSLFEDIRVIGSCDRLD